MDARHYISCVIQEEMDRLEQKLISLEQFNFVVDALERHKFVPEHDKYFPLVRKLALKINNGESDD